MMWWENDSYIVRKSEDKILELLSFFLEFYKH